MNLNLVATFYLKGYKISVFGRAYDVKPLFFTIFLYKLVSKNLKQNIVCSLDCIITAYVDKLFH